MNLFENLNTYKESDNKNRGNWNINKIDYMYSKNDIQKSIFKILNNNNELDEFDDKFTNKYTYKEQDTIYDNLEQLINAIICGDGIDDKQKIANNLIVKVDIDINSFIIMVPVIGKYKYETIYTSWKELLDGSYKNNNTNEIEYIINEIIKHERGE